MDKKLVLSIGFFLFSFGAFLGWELSEDLELPKIITIRREGKMIAYAMTSPEYGKIVTMNDVPDPGVYLAFPIYSDKKSVDRLVT